MIHCFVSAVSQYIQVFVLGDHIARHDIIITNGLYNTRLHQMIFNVYIFLHV